MLIFVPSLEAYLNLNLIRKRILFYLPQESYSKLLYVAEGTRRSNIQCFIRTVSTNKNHFSTRSRFNIFTRKRVIPGFV